MGAQLAAGNNASAVATSTFTRLTQKRHIPKRAHLGSLWGHLFHGFGRLLSSLPGSMWLAIDVSIFFVGLHFAYQTFPPPDQLATPHVLLWQAVGIYGFIAAVAGLIFGLYERETLQSRSRIATRLLLTAAAVAIVSYAVIYAILYSTIARRVTVISLTTYVISGTSIRLCAWWAIRRVRRGLLVVGSRKLFESFERAQDQGCLHEYNLAGYCTPSVNEDVGDVHPAHLGTLSSQVASLDESDITDIVVGKQAAKDPQVMDWMVPCLQRGCRVTNEAVFYEKAAGQILVDEITPYWFLFADLKVHCDQQATLRRILDFTVAIVGFCVTGLAWPVIALAIKLCDGGPVFYSQDRVGQNGQIFKLFKFRTMRVNAENGKSIWASPNDPRVTSIGRFLRKSRLDELPQLYNVLIGQMSIIGPRPERPDIVKTLCREIPYYAERHLVKPGITGWAQISFRYGSSISDAKRKLQFDLYYLKHMSFELDMMILLRTIGTFLRGGC